MCGIAGILYAELARPVERAAMKAMADSLAHRGPDAEGFWQESGVGLAHRRLAIIDIAGGSQPIGSEDDTVQVVFNGEIYNHRALRTTLEARGHRFRTQSDSEVLVHLYEERGEHMVGALRGMFAFAVWDSSRRRLLLARDRVGIKPLYVYRDAEKLLFASEMKAILAFPGVGRDVDLEALEDFLAFGVVPSPRSIFRKIEKLPPAHVLSVDCNTWDASPRRYWQLRFDPDEHTTLPQWVEQISAKLTESVQTHLMSDVPIGAFLSGGLDSSTVVARARDAGGGPLQTFSIGFSEDGFDELPHAREVARQFRTDHQEETITADAIDLLDDLTRAFDEPFGDPAALPTLLMSRIAAQHVKVVLSGDGGDEAFGGYARYAHDLREAAVRRRLPAWVRRHALAPLAQAWPKADWLPRPVRLKTAMTNVALDGPSAYANTLAICRPPLRRRLMNPDRAAQLNGHVPERILRDGYAAAPQDDALGAMIATDVSMLLPDDFLTKVDRAAMAYGLEVRPPLLDHELLELAARIPSRWKVHRGETKWILKQVMRDRLPDATLRAKHGFDVPVDRWLRGPLRDVVESVLLAPRAPVAALLDQSAVRKLYRSHLAHTGRYGRLLWNLLALGHWAQRYLP